MKKLLQFVFITLIFNVIFMPQAHAISFGLGDSRPESFADLVEAVSPAVVNIYTAKDVRVNPNPFRGVDPFFDQFFEDYYRRHSGNQRPQRQQNSLGSGFIISEDGKIITNYHVIDGADEILVNLGESKNVKVRLLGADVKLDLAVLQIEEPGSYAHVELGDSEALRVGDWVVAIGNPFGLGHTVTAGIVSAKGRVLGAGPYDNFIQTDASINPGNSGGPLFDTNGKVVGINNAVAASGQGIGFAIPASMVTEVLDQLINKGKVNRGWLGVSVRDLNVDEAKGQGNAVGGVYVLDVVAGGPADKTGMAQGDLVIKLDGKAVVNKQMLPSLVAAHEPGTTVTLTVLRNGQEKTFAVILGDLDNPNMALAYPIDSQANQASPDAPIGIDVRDLEAADKVGVPGVKVTRVHPNSVADMMGLARGDVITNLGGEAVTSVTDFKRMLGTLADGQVLKMAVWRGGKTIYFAFKK